MRKSRPLGEDVSGSLRSAICQLLPFALVRRTYIDPILVDDS
jgi:hypothetical protein